jgi:hypothetical protein
MIRLRATKNAHFSIRRIALQITEKIREIYPSLGAFIDAPDEDWRDVERRYFSSTSTI